MAKKQKHPQVQAGIDSDRITLDERGAVILDPQLLELVIGAAGRGDEGGDDPSFLDFGCTNTNCTPLCGKGK